MEINNGSRVLDIFQEGYAIDIVKSIIEPLDNYGFRKLLVTDNDITFALEPLLYSFRLPYAEKAISIFSQWLVDPTSPDAILDKTRYNIYIQQVFESIPVIYELRITRTQSILQITYDFLKDSITPNPNQFETLNGEPWSHPFNQKTWNASFRCIINSIQKTDPREFKEARDKLMSLFVKGILISDLKISDADNLLQDFFNLCFINLNDSTVSYDKYWYILFNEIFGQFISFPTDQKKKVFIVSIIKQMKKCSKDYEDKIVSGQSVNSINWPIRQKFFQNSLRKVIDIISSQNTNNILRSKLPGDSFVSLFSDCMFIPSIWEFYILEHINDLFKLFTYGDFSPESKWPELFIRYLCFLMQKKTSDSLFKVVYGILNSSCNFFANYPSFVGIIIKVILSKAAILQYPKFVLVSQNSFPTMKPEVIANPNILSKGSWVSTLITMLELIRIQNNQQLEKQLLLTIEKFCSCSEFPFIRNDINVYRLVLLAIAGKEDLFARLIVQNAPTSKPLRVERVWNFQLLTLALSPFFSSKMTDIIIENQVIEHILSNFKTQEFSNRHIFWFLITLFELSQSTDLFIRNRAIISPLVSYLKEQKKQQPVEQNRSDSNYYILKLIDIVIYSLLISTISGEEVKRFISNYQKLHTYAFNNRIITYCETNNTDFGLIIRGEFGISTFQVSEIECQNKPTIPESSLKDNILHRDEITFPADPIFPSYRDELSYLKNIKTPSKSFMMAMGIASIESNSSFHPIRPLQNDQQEVITALNEFDDLCGLVSLDVTIDQIPTEKESKSFTRFLGDLGTSYKLGTCVINFNHEKRNNDIVILFNETNLKLNSRLLSSANLDESSNHENHLVISVSPVYVEQNTLMYNVTIVRSKWQCLILPIPPKKSVLISKERLSRLISMICFFYFSRLAKDELVGRTTNNIEDQCPQIVAKYIDMFESRRGKLKQLIQLQKNEDTLNTIVSDDN